MGNVRVRASVFVGRIHDAPAPQTARHRNLPGRVSVRVRVRDFERRSGDGTRIRVGVLVSGLRLHRERDS